MKNLGLSRYALAIGAASALLAGCGGSQPPIAAPGVITQSRKVTPKIGAHRGPSSSYEVLYNFAGGYDGAWPVAALTYVNGAFYGTTSYGGSSICPGNGSCGTVFSISASGSKEVVHNFAGGSDGAHPEAALINVNGTLYGTTLEGGSSKCHKKGCGTVYSITPSGS